MQQPVPIPVWLASEFSTKPARRTLSSDAPRVSTRLLRNLHRVATTGDAACMQHADFGGQVWSLAEFRSHGERLDLVQMVTDVTFLGKIWGLAFIALEPIVEGGFAVLNTEQRFAFEFSCRQDMAFASIKQIIRLRRSMVAQHRERRRTPHKAYFRLHGGCIDQLLQEQAPWKPECPLDTSSHQFLISRPPPPSNPPKILLRPKVAHYSQHSGKSGRPADRPTAPESCTRQIWKRLQISKICHKCRGELGWCSDMTSTHGSWSHAEVQFLAAA